jgi:hypothetical protein
VTVPQIGSFSTEATFTKNTKIQRHIHGTTWLCGSRGVDWLRANEAAVHGLMTAPCRPAPGKPC